MPAEQCTDCIPSMILAPLQHLNRNILTTFNSVIILTCIHINLPEQSTTSTSNLQFSFCSAAAACRRTLSPVTLLLADQLGMRHCHWSRAYYACTTCCCGGCCCCLLIPTGGAGERRTPPAWGTGICNKPQHTGFSHTRRRRSHYWMQT